MQYFTYSGPLLRLLCCCCRHNNLHIWKGNWSIYILFDETFLTWAQMEICYSYWWKECTDLWSNEHSKRYPWDYILGTNCHGLWFCGLLLKIIEVENKGLFVQLVISRNMCNVKIDKARPWLTRTSVIVLIMKVSYQQEHYFRFEKSALILLLKLIVTIKISHYRLVRLQFCWYTWPYFQCSAVSSCKH